MFIAVNSVAEAEFVALGATEEQAFRACMDALLTKGWPAKDTHIKTGEIGFGQAVDIDSLKTSKLYDYEKATGSDFKTRALELLGIARKEIDNGETMDAGVTIDELQNLVKKM